MRMISWKVISSQACVILGDFFLVLVMILTLQVCNLSWVSEALRLLWVLQWSCKLDSIADDRGLVLQTDDYCNASCCGCHGHLDVIVLFHNTNKSFVESDLKSELSMIKGLWTLLKILVPLFEVLFKLNHCFLWNGMISFLPPEL